LSLRADTAADLMAPNPMSIRGDASIPEAIALLVDRHLHAAPVIDEAGRPIGVLSATDIIIHERERSKVADGLPAPAKDTQARDLMTPAVFSVTPETPAEEVIAQLLALRVHQLFVVDGSGVLIGVLSALDVLRQLQA
jgi:CBS-domain-containing membrane protein